MNTTKLLLCLAVAGSLAAAPFPHSGTHGASAHLDGMVPRTFEVTIGNVDALDITMDPDRHWGISLVLWDAETGAAVDARWSASAVGPEQYAAEIEGHVLESNRTYLLEATGRGDLTIAGADVIERTGQYQRSGMVTSLFDHDMGDTPSVIAAGGGYRTGTDVPIPADAYVMVNAIVASSELGSAALADSYACFVSSTSTCEQTKASLTSVTVGGVHGVAVASATTYIGGTGGQSVEQVGEHYAPARLTSRFMGIWFSFPRLAPARIDG